MLFVNNFRRILYFVNKIIITHNKLKFGLGLFLTILLTGCLPVINGNSSKTLTTTTETFEINATPETNTIPTKRIINFSTLTKTVNITKTPITETSNTPPLMFPTDIYPLATPPNLGWIGNQECANSLNLELSDEPPSNETILNIMKVVLSSGDLNTKQAVSDPAFWGQLSKNGDDETLTDDFIETVAPAIDSPYGDLLTNLCGENLVGKSWWAKICPGPCEMTTFEALKTNYFLIKRKGIWLLWATIL